MGCEGSAGLAAEMGEWAMPFPGGTGMLGEAGRARTWAPAAENTFSVRAAIKASFFPGSGLRTKSTAPADRASKTRRSREDTKMTGKG